jgi:hypothetical protein
MYGVVSFFPVRKPTAAEVSDPDHYPHVHMALDTPWDPYQDSFQLDEDLLRLSINDPVAKGDSSFHVMTIASDLCQISPIYDESLFVTSVKAYVHDTSCYHIHATQTSRRKGTVSPTDLANRWFIGIELARRTIEATTQRGVRDFTMTSGTQRMKHRFQQLLYRHLKATVYTDTLFTSIKSMRQNTCAQIYVTDFQWVKVYPLRRKADAHLSLDQLHRDFGVFHTIVSDNAPELKHGEFRRKAIHAGSVIRPIEAYVHNQNLAEVGIRELRRMYRKAMSQTNAPHILWDHCMELMAELRSHTALDLLALKGDTPSTLLTGDSPDISRLCEFKWYDHVWYIDPIDKMDKRKLARYLGPSHDVGQAMASKL